MNCEKVYISDVLAQLRIIDEQLKDLKKDVYSNDSIFDSLGDSSYVSPSKKDTQSITIIDHSSRTIVNNNIVNVSEKSVSKKEKKDEKENGPNLVGFALVAVPTVIATTYAIANDPYMRHWQTGVKQSWQNLRELFSRMQLNPSVGSQMTFDTKLRGFIQKLSLWIDMFESRTKPNMTTKASIGTLGFGAAAGYFLGMGTLLTCSVIGLIPVSIYGTWYYIQGNRVYEREVKEFESMREDLKDILAMRIQNTPPPSAPEEKLYPELAGAEWN